MQNFLNEYQKAVKNLNLPEFLQNGMKAVELAYTGVESAAKMLEQKEEQKIFDPNIAIKLQQNFTEINKQYKKILEEHKQQYQQKSTFAERENKRNQQKNDFKGHII